jgi:3-deoxy-D-manno-octulosonate 8-phosphate phosphatase KdsC-like HAD superfamily phosphatase
MFEAHNEAIRLAKEIEAVIFDSDGVLFPAIAWEGWYAESGAKMVPKPRSYADGQGVSLLRAIGIHVAFVTNEKGDHAQAIEDTVAKWNSLPSAEKTPGDGGWLPVGLYTGMGGPKKVIAAADFLTERQILKDAQVDWSKVAAMGDDLVDIPLLRKVAFPVAPAQAEEVVLIEAKHVTKRPGGAGAIRDFANFVLMARGIDPTTLPTS